MNPMKLVKPAMLFAALSGWFALAPAADAETQAFDCAAAAGTNCTGSIPDVNTSGLTSSFSVPGSPGIPPLCTCVAGSARHTTW